jgi:hypothetical protein
LGNERAKAADSPECTGRSEEVPQPGRSSIVILRVCAAATLLVLLTTTGILLAGGGDTRTPVRPPPAQALVTGPFRPSATGLPPALRLGRLVEAPGLFVFRAAADARHLVWVAGGVEDDRPAEVIQRELGTERATTLARGVDPAYGLASTTRWVVYAQDGPRMRLVATPHRGSGSVTLSRSLATPIAARGELVAWAEEARGVDRVLVRDMARGTTWAAATMPRCEAGRCYRVDTVALADAGVIFTRVATGPDTSLVVRRAFTDARPTQVPIDGDPQPDLVPASTGAVYQALGRGWYRWDFGRARPRRVLRGLDPETGVLVFEDGHWLLQTRRGCSSAVIGRDGGRSTELADPVAVARGAGGTHAVCAHLGAATWTGRQLLTAWGVIPPESIEAHEDHGATGLVAVSRPLSRRL